MTNVIGLEWLTNHIDLSVKMANIPISEAKAKLAFLVREVAATGQSYVISVNGLPLAELRAYLPLPTPGRFRNAIQFDDDAFAPLNDAEADEWGV